MTVLEKVQLNLGRKFLVRVTGQGCGRSRFVEARRFLSPWKCHARKLNHAEQAEAFVSSLAPAAGQSVEVVHWYGAWHEDLPDARWEGCPKIALRPVVDHRRRRSGPRVWSPLLRGGSG